METKGQQETFISYEYKERVLKKDKASLIIDGYQHFGWNLDTGYSQVEKGDQVGVQFKRDRVIRNKAELTRLQRQFDATVEDIQRLERAKSFSATLVAIAVGILGTACMAGSVFAVDAGAIALMVILAIPGFLGWIMPLFLYRYLSSKKGATLAPLLEEKYELLYQLTKQGNRLIQDIDL